MKARTDPLLRRLQFTLSRPDLTPEAKLDEASRAVRLVIEVRKAERMRRALRRTVRAAGVAMEYDTNQETER